MTMHQSTNPDLQADAKRGGSETEPTAPTRRAAAASTFRSRFFKRIRRIVQWLFTPALLLVLWLFLNESVARGQIALGIIVALVLAWAAYHLRPVQAVMRRPWTVLRLFFHVMADITRSNLAVFRLIVLGKQRSGTTPGFLRIPLRMQDPHGLAALACIITFTPGTVWADYSQDEHLLTLHVLDLKDEEHWRTLIRERYEAPLMEIYACTP